MTKKPFYRLAIFFILLYILNPLDAQNSIASQSKVEIFWANVSKNAHVLDGNWLFYENELFYPSDFEDETVEKQPVLFKLPAAWNTQKRVDGSKYPSYLHGTYRLKIRTDNIEDVYGLRISDIGSSSIVFIDDVAVYQCGTVGIDSESSIPFWKPKTIYFTPKNYDFFITIQVSNYHNVSGGIWNALSIGGASLFAKKMAFKISADFFLFGALLIMGFYHLILYILRRKAFGNLVFAIFTMLVSFRIFVSGEMILLDIMPFIGWNFIMKAAYITMVVPAVVFGVFINAVYPEKWFKRVNNVLIIISAFMFLSILLNPLRVYSNYLALYQLHVIICCVFILIVIIQKVIKRVKSSYFILLGIFMMLAAIINDILFVNGVVMTGFYTGFGLLGFVFMQSIVLAFDYSRAYKVIESQKNYLTTTNEAYARFVPKEFLIYLKKQTIIDINLGDHVSRDMSVLFSDIRDFSSLAEQMGQQETFNFLNSYLSRIGPIIRNNRGFIDKYIGDGVMALFPDDPFIAVKTGVEMQKSILRYNIDRSKSGYPPVSIGVGINCGFMLLGTIGEDDRMDSTVISDSVNIASRIESLTRYYGANIIIAESVLQSEKVSSHFNYRFLDTVNVKGKKMSVTIYEIFDGLDDDQYALKNITRDDYEQGIELYKMKRFEEAKKIFEKVIAVNSMDKAAEVFIGRCKRNIEFGVADDWVWVTSLSFK